jgi:hypothetical protein
MTGGISYRNEDDSIAGETEGWRLESELRYRYRQLDFTFGAEHDLLDRSDINRDSTYLYVRVKRWF